MCEATYCTAGVQKGAHDIHTCAALYMHNTYLSYALYYMCWSHSYLNGHSFSDSCPCR